MLPNSNQPVKLNYPITQSRQQKTFRNLSTRSSRSALVYIARDHRAVDLWCTSVTHTQVCLVSGSNYLHFPLRVHARIWLSPRRSSQCGMYAHSYNATSLSCSLRAKWIVYTSASLFFLLYLCTCEYRARVSEELRSLWWAGRRRAEGRANWKETHPRVYIGTCLTFQMLLPVRYTPAEFRVEMRR